MIHPTAIIGPGATIPETASVWQFAHVQRGTVLGEHVSIGGGAEVGTYCQIGEGTRIGFHAFLPNKTVVGRYVFIGPGAILCDDKHPQAGNRFAYKAEPPTLHDGCSIGAGAVILPGVTIGAYATVGAGATVTRDVAPGTTVYGERARLPAGESGFGLPPAPTGGS